MKAMKKKIKAETRPASNATPNKKHFKLLTDMDSDELLINYGNSVAGGESKKKLKMKVSGKSVFKLKEIIIKKA
ncbi:MAG: hypothetical protein UT50_C0002G0020 [Candidatus Moranbacteria bacterium GW2011_GWA2_39_41]|nr:MAG: hypothetical protein UT50_C0002G0020 [Candidatus Moranbacteria bacterium GW2011_GWA2_39_41]